MLTFDPSSDIKAIVTDCGQVRSGTTINGAVKYAEGLGYNTLAAVNADFFTISNGVPTGIVVENGKLISSDDGQNAVGFYSDGTAFMGAPRITLTAENLISGQSFRVSHYNKLPSQYTFNLLDRNFVSKLSLSGDWLIAVLEPVKGEMKLGKTVQFFVEELTQFNGSYTIPDDRMILIAKAETTAAERFSYLSEGDTINLNIKCADTRFNDAVWAVGGGDILVSEGQITPSSGWDSSISSRNPRTALGIMPDGKIVLYAGDGRQSSYSNGLTLSQLAGELLYYGCEYAINLDGGGSTAMSVRQAGDSSAQVVNSPSGGLRACGTYVLLVTDSASTGKAENLFIENDGAIVLPGAYVPLGEVLATDSGYRTVSAPADVSFSVDEKFGEIKDGALYTGSETGTAVIGLSSGGASGSGNIFVTDTITGISIKMDGKSVSSIKVFEGDKVQISASADYWNRVVWSVPENFKYYVPGGVGRISATGYITTGALSCGTGEVTVSYGSVSAKVPIYILPKFHDISSHWGADYINRLGENGIVKGSIENGKRYYYPDDMITREEFFTILARALKLDVSSYSGYELPFADSSKISGWAIDSIRALYAAGYLSGSLEHGALYANPDSEITRQEAFLTLSRLNSKQYDDEAVDELLSQFADAGDIAKWAKYGVYDMVRSNVVNGYKDGTIRPLNRITRAETAKIIDLYL